VPESGNWHGGTCTRWIAALSATPVSAPPHTPSPAGSHLVPVLTERPSCLVGPFLHLLLPLPRSLAVPTGAIGRIRFRGLATHRLFQSLGPCGLTGSPSDGGQLTLRVKRWSTGWSCILTYPDRLPVNSAVIQGKELSWMIKGNIPLRFLTSLSSAVTSSQPSFSARATYRQS
jgi:hypothetical protein